MFTTTGIIILVAYTFICASFSAYVASKKGYVGLWWFWLGLLFNFVVLIAAAGLPSIISLEERKESLKHNKQKKKEKVGTTYKSKDLI